MPPRFEGKFGIPSSHTVESELTKALYRLPESITAQEIKVFTKEIVHRVNSARSLDSSEDQLTESEILTLQLKLVRHFEEGADIASLNVPTFVDALVESPKFLNSDKGSIIKLFAMHEMKTLQKIAESRRKRSEQTESDGLNPYENLFETSSGNYYLAKLLNMPHLVEESDYMTHCVGTSTSYINKIKRGEVEIFSLREKSTHKPVVTIEYSPQSGRLLQVKMEHDGVPTHEEDFFPDLLESIEMLKGTVKDDNKMRTVDTEAVQYYKLVDSIVYKAGTSAPLDRNELFIIYEIDTTSFGFEGEKDSRVEELRSGRNRKEDVEMICNCLPEFIATDANDITAHTQVFCIDAGSKISFVDFREEKNKGKLNKIIEFNRTFSETSNPARLDVAIEGGIVNLNIDQKSLESLRTYESAVAAYKEADGGSSTYIFDELKNMPWTPPQSTILDVFIMNHGETTPQDRDKMVADMDKAGYRVLTFSELVALGIVRPDLNKRDEILNTYEKHTLGVTSRTPFLGRGGDSRFLGASHVGDVRDGRRRFLFVRK